MFDINQTGEYTIRDSPDGPGEASLVYAYVDFSADSYDYERAFAGTGAKMTVSKSGDSYTFKVSCPTILTVVGSENLPVDGDLQVHYSGELTDLTDDDFRKPGGRTELFLP